MKPFRGKRMGPRVSLVGFSVSFGDRPAFEIFTDSASAGRRSARALSASGCHDRFASRHEPGREVTGRFGDRSYNLPWRADLWTEDSTSPRLRAFARSGVRREDCVQCFFRSPGRDGGTCGRMRVSGRPSVAHPTRLETRTKESNMCASHEVLRNLRAQ